MRIRFSPLTNKKLKQFIKTVLNMNYKIKHKNFHFLANKGAYHYVLNNKEKKYYNILN